MNQQISVRSAWGFSLASMLAFAAWLVLTMALWGLPFHPWNSVALCIASLVVLYFWAATRPSTRLLVSRSIGTWEVTIFVAIVLAAIFGPAGQPFPRFALVMILASGGVAAVVVAVCGIANLVRWFIAGSGSEHRLPTESPNPCGEHVPASDVGNDVQ